MEYLIYQHGDALEKEASNFIEIKLNGYSKVWACFIGNDGKNRLASLPNYSNPAAREKFSEYSYTILESCFIMNQIINSGILYNQITNFDSYCQLNISLSSFWAHVGRAKDLMVRLLNLRGLNSEEFESVLDSVYQKRNQQIHGKRTPLVFDEFNLLLFPKNWDDKVGTWREYMNDETVYVHDLIKESFDTTINAINDSFEKCYDNIIYELKSLETKIVFNYKEHDDSKVGHAFFSGSFSEHQD